MTKKHWLTIAGEYANRVYGIGAADVICGGDEQEPIAHWYGSTHDLWDIYRLVDERANKYDLISSEQFDL